MLPQDVSAIDLEIKNDVKTDNSRNSSRKQSLIREEEEKNSHLSRKTTFQQECKRKWKDHFLEMHAREYLEQLKPEEYHPEKVFFSEISEIQSLINIIFTGTRICGLVQRLCKTVRFTRTSMFCKFCQQDTIQYYFTWFRKFNGIINLF